MHLDQRTSNCHPQSLREHNKKGNIMEGTTSLFEDSLSLSMDRDPTVLSKTVGDPAAMHIRCLNFLFLGCEPKMPYGPIEHTAELILDLLAQAAAEAIFGEESSSSSNNDKDNNSSKDTCWMLRMKLYNVQKDEYPTDLNEWDSYEGIILPGSFSAAYDDEPWIHKLCQVIQTEIVPKQRKTLGICFGHQVLAHSFEQGLASKMPDGSRAGRYTLDMTPAGKSLLLGNDKESSDGGDESPGPAVDYYYSHGDHVEKLPPSAVCLGGDENVPILAAAYYAQNVNGDGDPAADEQQQQSPYAITFQAHPEYASSTDLGLHRTLNLILDTMVKQGSLDKEKRVTVGQDVNDSYEKVRKDSFNTILRVGRLLKWFP